MQKIIGIVGSRSRDTDNPDFILVRNKFLDIAHDGDWICSGGCPKGGDRFAKMLHKELCIPYLEFPANWNKYGKSAGYRRNGEIAKFSDVLIACVSKDRKGGTEDTIQKFIELHGEENLHIV